ncbi:hypothetical protein [Salinivirga cyanobacteriivorans]
MFLSCENENFNALEKETNHIGPEVENIFDGLSKADAINEIKQFRSCIFNNSKDEVSYSITHSITLMEALYNYDHSFSYGNFTNKMQIATKHKISKHRHYLTSDEIFHIYRHLNNNIFDQYEKVQLENKKIKVANIELVEKEKNYEIKMTVIVGSFSDKKKLKGIKSFGWTGATPFNSQSQESWQAFNHHPIVYGGFGEDDSEATNAIENELIIENNLSVLEFYANIQEVNCYGDSPIGYDSFYEYDPDILGPGYTFNNNDEYPAQPSLLFPTHIGLRWLGYWSENAIGQISEDYYNIDYKRMNKYYNIISYLIEYAQPSNKEPIEYNFTGYTQYVLASYGEWYYVGQSVYINYGEVFERGSLPQVPSRLD